MYHKMILDWRARRALSGDSTGIFDRTTVTSDVAKKFDR